MNFPGQTEGLDTPPTSRLENNNNNNNNKYMEAIIFIIFSIILFMFFHKLWEAQRCNKQLCNCKSGQNFFVMKQTGQLFWWCNYDIITYQ